MRDVLNPWANPVTWAVPFFLLFIGIELAALKWLDHDDVTGYQPKDASTSIMMGLGSLASTLVFKAAAFFVYIALYLPQAKIYLGGCAAGPWIVPAWEIPDPYGLTIELTIARGGAVAWEGSASTAALHRKIDELAGYLFREERFPAGVILSTGTSLVPDLPFTLAEGDEVRIRISGIGELVNPVVRGKAALLGRGT